MNLQALFEKHNFHPKKRWGQNFLIDENIRRKIIKAADLQRDDTIIEIGPGFGVLSEEILKKAKRVIAIEKDKRLVEILKDRFGDFPNLEIINKDILKVDFRDLKLAKETKVIGNLPYYITTPIIFHLFKQKGVVDFILITVQKEVGERLTAKPGNKNYSILSVKAKFFSQPRVVFKISAKSFFPVPKVDSCLARLDVYKEKKYFVQDGEVFFKIIEAAFSQRRKTILNCLTSNFSLSKDLGKKLLRDTNVDFKRRGETLTLEEFIKLSKNFAEIRLSPERNHEFKNR
ncbi:MAG: hypothetical protein B5M48_00185 [Candidatus Omnitrophica bacterium 4484_213]|nr:MAG: hypothetical protein B5M48_00185 [Candidatus Omnitrophica bacterium 4484_213]